MDAMFVLAGPQVPAAICVLGTVCWGSRFLSDALQDPEDAVPVGQRRAWCWCMCFGLAFMLAGVILGGAYLYKYFAFQVSQIRIFLWQGCNFLLLCPNILKREEEQQTKPSSLATSIFIFLKTSAFLKAKCIACSKVTCWQGRAGAKLANRREQHFWKPYFAEKGLYLNRSRA